MVWSPETRNHEATENAGDKKLGGPIWKVPDWMSSPCLMALSVRLTRTSYTDWLPVTVPSRINQV